MTDNNRMEGIMDRRQPCEHHDELAQQAAVTGANLRWIKAIGGGCFALLLAVLNLGWNQYQRSSENGRQIERLSVQLTGVGQVNRERIEALELLHRYPHPHWQGDQPKR